jgi:hypothetical protein
MNCVGFILNGVAAAAAAAAVKVAVNCWGTVQTPTTM